MMCSEGEDKSVEQVMMTYVSTPSVTEEGQLLLKSRIFLYK